MPKIITPDGEKEVKNSEQIKEACRELGIPFGCENGLCATCEIVVEEGMVHLGEKNEKEKNMGLADDHRLACQCKINGGNVRLRRF